MISTAVDDIHKSVDYEPTFRPFAPPDDFFAPCGKEHFRLLAYLSAQWSNTTIINIHTNGGYEALALSYNPTNTVLSFDTANRVQNPAIANRSNIHFETADILDPLVRETWRESILRAALIFVDIEPHDGVREYELYQYLDRIGYRGVIIFDDIWYFQSMRNHLWYKIPDPGDTT